jgi:hypothetical protein
MRRTRLYATPRCVAPEIKARGSVRRVIVCLIDNEVSAQANAGGANIKATSAGRSRQENWSVMGADVKGDVYQGLPEKNAQDTKPGAGLYFTPRALIQGMVDCIASKPGETVWNRASRTGGFRHSYRIERRAAGACCGIPC